MRSDRRSVFIILPSFIGITNWFFMVKERRAKSKFPQPFHAARMQPRRIVPSAMIKPLSSQGRSQNT
jgi:hypothetical protein